MANHNLLEEECTFTSKAVFSKDRKSRYLLNISWDNSKNKLAIIMTFPSTADSMLLDQTTMLVRNGAIKHGYGSVTILNVLSLINEKQPKTDKINLSTILSECRTADEIIIAYGRSMSYQEDKAKLLEMLVDLKDKMYTIIDSKGLPYSHPLSPLAHEWNIQKLEF